MDQGEVAQFLDQVESGEDLSKKEKLYHEKNQVRDLAMMQLMLGTGIRVSECVGLKLLRCSFQNNAIRIIEGRQGGSIYFPTRWNKA